MKKTIKHLLTIATVIISTVACQPNGGGVTPSTQKISSVVLGYSTYPSNNTTFTRNYDTSGILRTIGQNQFLIAYDNATTTRIISYPITDLQKNYIIATFNSSKRVSKYKYETLYSSYFGDPNYESFEDSSEITYNAQNKISKVKTTVGRKLTFDLDIISYTYELTNFIYTTGNISFDVNLVQTGTTPLATPVLLAEVDVLLSNKPYRTGIIERFGYALSGNFNIEADPSFSDERRFLSPLFADIPGLNIGTTFANEINSISVKYHNLINFDFSGQVLTEPASQLYSNYTGRTVTYNNTYNSSNYLVQQTIIRTANSDNNNLPDTTITYSFGPDVININY